MLKTVPVLNKNIHTLSVTSTKKLVKVRHFYEFYKKKNNTNVSYSTESYIDLIEYESIS